MTAPQQLVPDTKDWTWVLTRPCEECGFDTHALEQQEIGPTLLRAADALVAALGRPDVASRPAPDVWSPLEYACHVRDVCRVFTGRLHRMLTEDDPAFENWDQDATAVADEYASQDPRVVARQLTAEARTLQRRRGLHRADAGPVPRARPRAPRVRRDRSDAGPPPLLSVVGNRR